MRPHGVIVVIPIEVVEYVVIHELAHLREPNHTEAFWLLVEQQELNYEEHSEWLTKHGTQLIFSEGHL